jgi:hypothetical protein
MDLMRKLFTKEFGMFGSVNLLKYGNNKLRIRKIEEFWNSPRNHQNKKYI